MGSLISMPARQSMSLCKSKVHYLERQNVMENKNKNRISNHLNTFLIVSVWILYVSLHKNLPPAAQGLHWMLTSTSLLRLWPKFASRATGFKMVQALIAVTLLSFWSKPSTSSFDLTKLSLITIIEPGGKNLPIARRFKQTNPFRLTKLLAFAAARALRSAVGPSWPTNVKACSLWLSSIPSTTSQGPHEVIGRSQKSKV